MTQRIVRNNHGYAGLIGLNAGLLGLLAWLTLAPQVGAQQGFRPRGDYHMVAGNAAGSASAVILIADEVNEQLVGLTYDPNLKTLSPMGARDLAQDLAQFGRGR